VDGIRGLAGESIISRSFTLRKMGFGKKPAILVVDFQKAFTKRGSPLGGSDLIMKAVKNTKRLLKKARERRVPVFYSVMVYENSKEMGLFPLKFRNIDVCKSGSEWAEVDDEVKQEEGDIVIVKKAFSPFFGTPLAVYLHNLGVDTVIIAGCITSGCVRAAAIDSFSHGFRTVIPEDCVGDRALEPHKANLYDMNLRQADVVTLEEVLEYLGNL